MELREKNVQALGETEFDVLIVGGGINGAVAAAALAAKGVSVALVDQGDFACETSSQSSNLIWGGIKYLESHEYRLVKKLCESRNLLTASYPATIKEIRFLTTIQKGFRYPVFFVYTGTLFYWIIGRFFTKPPHFLSAKKIKQLEPVINTENAQGGFEYSDCYLFDNDARFVFNFIRKSLDSGATVANYVKVHRATRQQNLWHLEAEDVLNGKPLNIRAKAMVNACGPFVDAFNQNIGQKTKHHHVFSKGIHLIVDRITPSKKVLAFFAADGRLFFVIPMGPRTCIGTTDTQVHSPKTTVTKEDRQFVLDNANRLLDLVKPLTEEDILSERCGVRPLAVLSRKQKADWVQLSRKHIIDINKAERYLSIFGGKLTDCIHVGNEVVDIIESFGIAIRKKNKKWYGEDSASKRQAFYRQAQQLKLDDMTDADAHERLSDRFWRRYGEKAIPMLNAIEMDKTKADMVIPGTQYRRCELEYMADNEMISRLEDFLRRRSKIELIMHDKKLEQRATLYEACTILFGKQGEDILGEYLQRKKKLN